MNFVEHYPDLQSVCRRYGVARLSLFGSVLIEYYPEDSDIDCIVAFIGEAMNRILQDQIEYINYFVVLMLHNILLIGTAQSFSPSGTSDSP